MNRQTALEILIATLEKDGGTFKAETGEQYAPDAGYAVAVQDANDAIVVSIDDDREKILDFIQGIDGEYLAPYIGTWIDKENMLYIDPVVIIYDFDDAIELGLEFNQAAIWSFGDMDEIYL